MQAVLSHVFPRTMVTATLFSKAFERVFKSTVELPPSEQDALLVLPKGTGPSLEALFGTASMAPSGHVCVVGPTGSGKSTIVRHILVGLSDLYSPFQAYSLESPVEVSMETHGVFGSVNQVDMFMKPAGRERTLDVMAAEILRSHDPDLIYFGELRTKKDFETAAGVALSGVAVVSTGHAASPVDLLDRLAAMNIDMTTQLRALRTVVGVKRVPVLCPACRLPVELRPEVADASKGMRLLSEYCRWKGLSADRPVVVYFARDHACREDEDGDHGSKDDGRLGRCPQCQNSGYLPTQHTIYEYMHIDADAGDDVPTLKRRHAYWMETQLLHLVLEGFTSPVFLEAVISS